MRSKFIVIFIITLFVCSTSEARSLRGVWDGKVSSSWSMTAYISKHKIRINLVSDDFQALYWVGSFDSTVNEGDVQVSKANRKKMDGAVLASYKKYKGFRYRNDSVTFWFGISGVKRRIYLYKR